MKNSVHSKG